MSDAYEASIDPAATSPVVTDALDDRVWFAKHPDRLFRYRASAGGVWLTRRRRRGADPDVYLRTLCISIVASNSDSDGNIAMLWYPAAHPDWPIEKTQEWARKALRKGES